MIAHVGYRSCWQVTLRVEKKRPVFWQDGGLCSLGSFKICPQGYPEVIHRPSYREFRPCKDLRGISPSELFGVLHGNYLLKIGKVAAQHSAYELRRIVEKPTKCRNCW